MEAKEIGELIDKYLSGQANTEEKALIENWYGKINVNQSDIDPTNIEQYKQETNRFLLAYIGNQRPQDQDVISIREKKYKIAIYRWLSAAVVLLSLGTIIYFHNKKPINNQLVNTNKPLINDVAPGGNKAILTLSNGHQLVLTSVKNGIVATQGNIIINKTSDGKVIYNADQNSSQQAGDELTYNTIATPIGGTYYLMLSDGTQVWLNAASSIKYPVAFKGSERVVELTGEAYFEVAKNKEMPFKVKSSGQTVEVLGTHFNINSYSNEVSIKTTLLEGSVKIAAAGTYTLLKPGQQSSFNASAYKPVKVSDNVDLAEVMAWKNGKFLFAGADIQTVMRQLERWYDVEAVYDGNRPSDHFYGKIPKDVNLSQVLRVLELSGVNFKIEGRKVIIR